MTANPELDRAVARIKALPKPPTCPQCSGVIEASWWSYCAGCGYHIALRGVAGETLRDSEEK